jgi:hypothetical protein
MAGKKDLPYSGGELIENLRQLPTHAEMEAYAKAHPEQTKEKEEPADTTNAMGDKYALGGITERPHLGFIPRSEGGSIMAKGNKLARLKPTKLY